MSNNLEKFYKEPFISIIDDFYDDLEWLDDFLANNRFFYPEHTNYAGQVSGAPSNSPESMFKINELLEFDFNFDSTDGEIRCTSASDIGKEKFFVHVDDHALLSIIVYLSDPPEEKDSSLYGTYFYTHKDLRRQFLKASSPIKYKFQKNIVLKDSKDESKWEIWHKVPYKKNRALIFNSLLFHSPPPVSFGLNQFDSRLTQHFFAKIRQGNLGES